MLIWRQYGKKIIFLKVAALVMVRIFFVASLCCAEPFIDEISLSNRSYLRTPLLGNSDKGKSRLKDGLALMPLVQQVTVERLNIDLHSTGAPHFRITSDILEIEMPQSWDSKMTRTVARFNPELIREAIRDVLLDEERGFIQYIIRKLGLDIRQIKSIKVLLAQEGPYYGVFRGDITLNTGEVRYFGLNVALNSSLNGDLEKDYQNLNLLHNLQNRLGLKFVPQPYVLGKGKFLDKMGEPIEMQLFAVEWLGDESFTPYQKVQGINSGINEAGSGSASANLAAKDAMAVQPWSFIELHRDRFINGNRFYLLPNYIQRELGKSYAHLDYRETSYIRKQIISLLTSIFAASFEEGKGGLVIKRVSINNGDFMVRKSKDEGFDICLITARDLEQVSPAEFMDYLLGHEHDEFVEVIVPASGGIVETSVKKFRFYDNRSEVEKGIIDGLTRVYGYEKAQHLTKAWFGDFGLYDDDSVTVQAGQINPIGMNPKRTQIDIGRIKALEGNI